MSFDLKEILINKKTDSNWIKYNDPLEYSYSYKLINSTEQFQKKVIFPENGIYIINDGYLSVPDGFTLSGRFELFTELCWIVSFENLDHNKNKDYIYNYLISIFQKLTNNKIIKLKGRCLNLFSLFAEKNYYHFMIDHCTKLDMVSKFDLNFFDYIYVPDANFYFKDILYRFYKLQNVSHKIITNKDFANELLLQFNELYSVSNRGLMRNVRPKSLDNILKIINQNTKIDHSINSKEMIFLSRKNQSRHIKGIEKIFAKIGFEIIEDPKSSKTFDKIRNASVIAGQHGANLTNILLANDKCKFIEIFNYDYVYEYYMSLSNAVGISNYFGIIQDSSISLNSLIRKLIN